MKLGREEWRRGNEESRLGGGEDNVGWGKYRRNIVGSEETDRYSPLLDIVGPFLSMCFTRHRVEQCGLLQRALFWGDVVTIVAGWLRARVRHMLHRSIHTLLT